MRAAYAAGVEVTQVTERAAAALSDAVTPAGHRRALRHPGHRPGRAAGRLTDAAGGAGADQRPRQRGHPSSGADGADGADVADGADA